MDVTINFPGTLIDGEVVLPASKSISNRVLIIHALAESDMPVGNLADCDDTNSMLRVLQSNENTFNIGHAGTAMRFLTAFLSRIVGKWEITGSDRMKQRPISILVDALNDLGGRIEYMEKEGFPPLRIYGSNLSGGEIEISASVSSQYISALMMIAPYMTDGLVINLTGKTVSHTYLDMTAGIMREFGAKVELSDRQIRIAPQPYKPVSYLVESDWSAASYFYELLAIAGNGTICLSGLSQQSLQGDARQIAVWEKLGVKTYFEEGYTILKFTPDVVSLLEYDFVEMPDLVQSFTVACCLKGVPFVFSGVETLRIKETDRISALVNELAKLGYRLTAVDDRQLIWDGSLCKPAVSKITTYHDHRMAMAFAPAAWKYPELTICDGDVVSKSFPGYWEQLERLGVIIKN